MNDPHIDKWKAKLQKLEGQMKESSADARIEIQDRINEIKQKMKEND
jgi:hypothetical protein